MRRLAAASISAVLFATGCVGEIRGQEDATADRTFVDGLPDGAVVDRVVPIDAQAMDAPNADVVSTDAGPSGPCTPQIVEACSCADGASGTRSCLPNGEGYAACDCTTYGRAIYVAPTGNDAASGDASAPKATLDGALAVVRGLVSSGGIPAGGVVIWMAGGMYPVSATVTIDATMSGSMGRPVVIRAQPGAPVRFVGGQPIAASAWSPLATSDPAYARVDTAARSAIRVADLASVGIADYGTLRTRGFGASNVHSALELFGNGRPLRLGRWPDIDQNEVVEASPSDSGVTLYGTTTPNVTGRYTATGTMDGVNAFVRDGLVGGLQYRLYRYSWTYMGTPYRAWFVTTSPSAYPSNTDPWWYLYQDGFTSPMQPNNGATGELSWTDVTAANHGFVQNAGAVSDTVIRYYGTRPSRWTAATDAWVHGFWKYGWADRHFPLASIDTAQQRLTLGGTPDFGTADGTPWYAYNLLEEVTQPGEWYLDRTRGRLYLYPPSDLATTEIVASTLDAPLVRLSNAQYVEFRGIAFEVSRAALLDVSGSHNRFVGVTLRNGGSHGATVNGNDNGFTEAVVTGVGSSGIRLSGGDRPSLTAANNFVERSNLYEYARWDYPYSAAVEMSGVAQRASNNLIHDAPHNAILYNGNEHLIERNEIHHVVRWAADAGAIYGGRDWGGRGVIIRNNYLHHLHTDFPGGFDVVAVYLDDCLSGIRVDGNIITDVGGRGVLHGGGRDDIIVGNVMVRARLGVTSDARCTTWARPSTTPGDSGNLLEKLQMNNYQSPPWSIRYPECAAIPNNYTAIFDPAATWLFPEGSRIASNVAYQIPTWLSDSEGAFMHIAQSDNPELMASPFVDEASGDLTQTATVLAVPGFVAIPVSQIGIHP